MDTSSWTAATSAVLHQLSPSNSFVSCSSVDNAPTLLNDADIDSCWHSYNEQTNTRLLHVLSDLVKAFVDTESDIQKNLEKMGFSSSEESSSTLNKEDIHPSLEDTIERLSICDTNTELSEDGPDLITPNSTFYSSLALSARSKELSQSNVSVEDDVVLGASRRLRAAVERILRLLNEIVNLNQGHDVQDIVRRNDELVNDLNEEIRRRDKLTHQLLIAEEQIKLLETDKIKANSEKLEYEEMQREFYLIKSKVERLEAEREAWFLEKEELNKYKSSFLEGLPKLQQKCTNLERVNKATQFSFVETANFEELISDAERLNENICALQQENNALKDKMNSAESKAEKTRNQCDQLRESKKHQYEELISQVEAAEKQVSSYRKFIQEQALEREAERDEFNREIEVLNRANRDKEKLEKKLQDNIESYQAQLDLLLEEKKSFVKKQAELELKINESNQTIADLRSLLIQTERESEKFASLEQKLIKQCNDLEEALQYQVLMNEKVNRENLNTSQNLTISLIDSMSFRIDQIKKLLGDDITQSIITNFTEVKQNQSRNNISTLEETNIDCSFLDLQTLGEKLHQLNCCIDGLLTKNLKLACELKNLANEKQNFQQKFCEGQKSKEKLEHELSQALRTVDLLQEELNAKHLQLSALKTRLDGTSCLDINQYKTTISEYKKKLIIEELRVESLEQEIDSIRNTLEEANFRIRQLVEEMQILENSKETLEMEKNDLINEKEALFTEKIKLCREIDELKVRPRPRDEDDVVVPQILQMVVKDKNEEIQDLTNQLKIVKTKLGSFFPKTEKNVQILLDEFIKSFNEYKEIAKNSKILSLGVDSGISQSQSLPSSPRTVILKEKCTSTDCSLIANNSFKDNEFQKRETERRDLIKRLEETELRCDQMYYALNNCKEENDQLRHKLKAVEDEKIIKNGSSRSSTTANHETDIELSEGSLETALQKLHNQSMELVKLSESRRNQKDSLLWLIIEALTSLVSEKPDHKLIDGLELKQKLIKNFPNEEICSMLVQKLINIQKMFLEYRNRLQYYLEQNELITSQMADVEELSSKVQINSLMFQRKYQEMKKRLANYLNKDTPNLIISDQSELLFKHRICLSHKNSLIYQKKYLLNVLGGFQLTEKAILALLANSNVTTEKTSSYVRTKKSQFKCAVWVLVAIKRIRFLQKKHSSPNHHNYYHVSSKLPNYHTSPFHLSPNNRCLKKGCFAKHDTDMAFQEFHNRIKKLHRTIGHNGFELLHSGDNGSDCLESN